MFIRVQHYIKGRAAHNLILNTAQIVAVEFSDYYDGKGWHDQGSALVKVTTGDEYWVCSEHVTRLRSALEILSDTVTGEVYL